MKDVGDLAQQFLNAQGLIGNSVRIPSEHASDEDRAAFRRTLLEKVPGLAEVSAEDPDALRATMRQLGAPAEATGYKLPEGLPQEGLKPVEGFNEWAHEANLTQAQFEALAKRFTAAQTQGLEARAAEHNAAMEALHKDWGYAYDQNKEAAIATAKLTGAPEAFITALENDKVPPEWTRYMHSLSKRFGDEGQPPERDGSTPEMTPAEAQAQYDEIMNNRQHPFWTMAPGPEKQRVLAQVQWLKERAMGKGARRAAATFGQPDEVEVG